MSDNKMLLVSNHLLYIEPTIKLPKDAIIRINLAWVSNEEELRKYLSIDYDVMVDYPEGRKKPPIPNLSYIDMLDIVGKFNNVKYIAISNIESGDMACLYKKSMDGISFVPKIETARGANNIIKIIEQSKPEYVMIDTEDLFLDVKGDIAEYQIKCNYITSQCNYHKVKILKIQGVIFGEV